MAKFSLISILFTSFGIICMICNVFSFRILRDSAGCRNFVPKTNSLSISKQNTFNLPMKRQDIHNDNILERNINDIQVSTSIKAKSLLRNIAALSVSIGLGYNSLPLNPASAVAPSNQATKATSSPSSSTKVTSQSTKPKDAEPAQKLGEELAIEGAVSNNEAAKLKINDLNKEISDVKSKIGPLTKDIQKIQSQIDRLEKKATQKNIDKDVLRLTQSQIADYKKEVSKLRVQLVSSENAITRAKAEIVTLKKRITDTEKFIKDKTIALKERKLQIEVAKKREEEKKALKIAQDKAAAKEKALASAQSLVNLAKREEVAAETALKIAQAKLVPLNENLKKEVGIQKKMSSEIASIEAKLKKAIDAKAVEDKKVSDVSTKISSVQEDVKKASEILAAKKAALVTANDALKKL